MGESGLWLGLRSRLYLWIGLGLWLELGLGLARAVMLIEVIMEGGVGNAKANIYLLIMLKFPELEDKVKCS